MSIEGQGHFFTIYFPGFVCFVLYKAKILGERLQDHWSSGLCIPGTEKIVNICIYCTYTLSIKVFDFFWIFFCVY